MDPTLIFSSGADILAAETLEFKRVLAENVLDTCNFQIKGEVPARVHVLEQELIAIDRSLAMNAAAPSQAAYLLAGVALIFLIIITLCNIPVEVPR